MNFTDLPNDQFIDVATLGTLTGSSLAVMFVANVAQYVFDWNPRWFGLWISCLISIGLTLAAAHGELIDWLVCIVKAFQIYATAVGIATITARKNPSHRIGNSPQKENTKVQKQFLPFWY
jgi:hypothetical protein